VANPTEAQTRKQLIDPALEKAGWDVKNPDQVGIEIGPLSFRLLGVFRWTESGQEVQ
jgi:hypothetical protein